MVERIKASVARLNVLVRRVVFPNRGCGRTACLSSRSSSSAKRASQGARRRLVVRPALEEEDGLGEQVRSEKDDRVVIRSNGEPTTLRQISATC